MKVTRRGFIKASAVTGLLAFSATGCGPNTDIDENNDEDSAVTESGEWIASTCQGCTTWCPVQVYVVGGRAIKIRGNPNAKANHGEVCPRAHLSLQQVYDPDRVKVPMKRTNPKKGRDEDPGFVPISWEEAADTIADKLLELRENDETHKMSVWRGRYTAMNGILYGAFPKIFGTPNNISHSSICAEADKFGPYYSETMWGYRDYDHANTKYELLWGADPVASNRQVAHTISVWGDVKDKAKTACIDPRLTATAAKSDEWLSVIPGEDSAIAVAIAHVILTEGLWSKEFVGDFKDGVNRFKVGQEVSEEDFEEIQTNGLVKWWNIELKDRTPEWAAERAGVSAEKIRKVAVGFGEAAPNAISFLAPGSCMQVRGAAASMATHVLNGLVGSVDNEGGTLDGMSVPLNGFPSEEDYIDEIAKAGNARARIDNGGTLQFPALKNGKSGGVKMTGYVAKAHLDKDPYDLKVVISYWNNFNFSNSETDVWDEAFEKIPFMVHLTVNPAEQSHYSDIILPCNHHLFERLSPISGSKGNRHSHCSLNQRVIEPLWDVKVDETEITWLIAEALAKKGFTNLLDYLKNEFKDPETGKSPSNGEEFNDIAVRIRTKDIWDPSVAKEGDNLKSWEEFTKLGVWNSDAYPYRKKWNGNFGTKTGKFEFYSETLKEALEGHAEKHGVTVDKVMDVCKYTARGEKAFVPHYEPAYYNGEKKDYPFVFIDFKSRLNREGRSANTLWYNEFKGVDPSDEPWDDVAIINPEDGEKLGLKNGDKIKITSPTGNITVNTKLWEGIRPGVLGKSFGQGHWAYGRVAALEFSKKPRGGNNNTLLPTEFERLSGSTARHSVTRVKVEKV